jgi:hypothetical protein
VISKEFYRKILNQLGIAIFYFFYGLLCLSPRAVFRWVSPSLPETFSSIGNSEKAHCQKPDGPRLVNAIPKQFGNIAAKDVLTPKRFFELENQSEEVIRTVRIPAAALARKLLD